MTKMSRFLALIPVVVSAAACNGVAPTGPSQITSNDSYESAGAVTAMTPSCRNLGRISLTVLPAVSPILWVEANYQYTGPSLGCPAPRWTSDRVEMVIDRNNPMRAGFPRTAGGNATLTATAPNRVTKSITVDLGATRDEQACKDVAGVSVKIVPINSTSGDVSLQATYRYFGSVSLGCSAPAWTASRRGLNLNPYDPFRASIARRTTVRTTVTATAPNGLSGSVTF